MVVLKRDDFPSFVAFDKTKCTPDQWAKYIHSFFETVWSAWYLLLWEDLTTDKLVSRLLQSNNCTTMAGAGHCTRKIL